MLRCFILLLIVTISACAPSRFVQPLAINEQAIGFNLGGSLIDYSGTTIPVPLTAITYGRGLKENLTIFGSLHTTSLLFNNLQLEAGAVFQWSKQEGWKPGLSNALVFNFITELSEGNAKLWPQIDGNAFWNFNNKKHTTYLGYSLWIDNKIMADNGIGVFNPHLGYTYRKGDWDFNTELKFLAPAFDNSKVFVPYQSAMGSQGANGIYFNISKRF